MERNKKKDRFVSENQPKSKAGTYFLIGILGVAIMTVGAFFALRKPDAPAWAVNVGTTSYAGKTLQMTKIPVDISGGKVSVNLDDIKNKKMVTFEVPGVNFNLDNGTPFDYLPLLAYVSPKGNVVVATSLCEPCSGITFSISNDTLVCNTCGTTWELEGLKGIQGGCPQYPPEIVEYKAEGGKLVLDEAKLKQWQPRPLGQQ